ncbi:hypothetical protein BJ878DRAFT_479057 [Calycina marina]|uniref:Uncharacterized protein n=1 Tax=Calycina marina TaxID=1763456 RepID=A0A9P7Z6A2_9HELO|nr:hypothetical protein BJ878DRAFT_479057 [Calycina marina]
MEKPQDFNSGAFMLESTNLQSSDRVAISRAAVVHVQCLFLSLFLPLVVLFGSSGGRNSTSAQVLEEFAVLEKKGEAMPVVLQCSRERKLDIPCFVTKELRSDTDTEGDDEAVDEIECWIFAGDQHAGADNREIFK